MPPAISISNRLLVALVGSSAGHLVALRRDDPGDPSIEAHAFPGTLTILPIDMVSYILSQMPPAYRSRQ
jgi:hypothetical protein